MKVRDNHLRDPETSRDLFGVVRGKCMSCTSCGRYVVRTQKYRTSTNPDGVGSQQTIHPDSNLSLLDCSRCGCPSDAHIVDESGTARERGNDAMALSEYEVAIGCYTEAISCTDVDWRLFCNRSLCYIRRGWFQQALNDAEKAVALNPDYKCYYRLGTALAGLGRYEEGLRACRQAMGCLCGREEKENERAVRALEIDIRAKMGRREKRGKGVVNKVNKEEGKARGDGRKVDSGRNEQHGYQVGLNGVEEAIKGLEMAVCDLVDAQRRQEMQMVRIEERLGRLLRESRMDGECFQEFPEEYSGKSSDKQREEEEQEQEQHPKGWNDLDVCDDETGSEISDVSDASSSSSDLSHTIADITRAWEERLGKGTKGSEPEELRESEDSARDGETSVPASEGASRKSTGALEEENRQRRVDASKRRVQEAAEIGEVLMSTDLDMLAQQRRTACTSCSSCPGFRILYSNTDVHNTEIMFFCSECGCPSEEHEVDEAFALQQAAEREREERAARERAARAKRRTGGSENKRSDALAVLGLHETASDTEVRSAFRKLAKAYHPDKAQSRGLERSQEMFVRIREARDVLLGDAT